MKNDFTTEISPKWARPLPEYFESLPDGTIVMAQMVLRELPEILEVVGGKLRSGGCRVYIDDVESFTVLSGIKKRTFQDLYREYL